MRKVFFGVLLLAIFVIAVLNVSAAGPRGSSCGIGNPGEGWDCTCDGEVILSKSIYWGEVWVTCDMPERNFGKSQDWERGCYNLVYTWRVYPGEFHIVCEEDGIP